MDNTQVATVESPTTEVAFPKGEAREHFMRTGEMPEPKKEDAATSTHSETSSSAPDKATSASVSEADKATQEKNKDTAATRLNEILADLKKAGLSPSELKSFKREAQAQETKAESSTAKPEKKEVAAEKYVGLDEAKWNAEHPSASYDDWIDAKTEHKAEFISRQTVSKVLADRDASESKQRRETEAAKQRNEAEQSWSKRVGEFKKANPEFDPAVSAGKLQEAGVKPGSLIDGWILDSEVGPALLKHLADNPDEINRIGNLSPLAAARALTRLEITFEPAKSQETTPARKVSNAPNPVSIVGGKGTLPADEADDAFKRGDTRSYMAAENARELRARQGK